MHVRYYLRLILEANYLLLHVQSFYKQRPKEHKGVGSVRSFSFTYLFISGTSALVFHRFDSMELQWSKKPLVNWLGFLNFLGFFDATRCENVRFYFFFPARLHCKVHKRACLVVFCVHKLGTPGPSGRAGVVLFWGGGSGGVLFVEEKMVLWHIKLWIQSWI